MKRLHAEAPTARSDRMISELMQSDNKYVRKAASELCAIRTIRQLEDRGWKGRLADKFAAVSEYRRAAAPNKKTLG